MEIVRGPVPRRSVSNSQAFGLEETKAEAKVISHRSAGFTVDTPVYSPSSACPCRQRRRTVADKTLFRSCVVGKLDLRDARMTGWPSEV